MTQLRADEERCHGVWVLAQLPDFTTPLLTTDEKRHRVVMWAGTPDDTVASTTWEWDGTHWEQRVSQHAPPSVAAALGWDGVSNRVILVGLTGSPTWAWDGTDWLDVTTGAAPNITSFGGLAWNEKRQRLQLLEADNLWEWDGSGWKKVRTSIAGSIDQPQHVVYDPTREALVELHVESETWCSVRALGVDGWYAIGSGLPRPWGDLASIRLSFDPQRNELEVIRIEDTRYLEVYRIVSGAWRKIQTVTGYQLGSARLFQPVQDQVRGRTLFMVFQDNALETWSFDGAVWSLLVTRRPSVDIAPTSIAVPDEEQGRVVATGSYAISSWNGDWSLRPVPSPRMWTVQYDSRLQETVGIGLDTWGRTPMTWVERDGGWEQTDAPFAVPQYPLYSPLVASVWDSIRHHSPPVVDRDSGEHP